MKDKREPLWAKQRKERGFDDRDTWSLDYTLAQWLVPRLKRFKEVNNGFPIGLTHEKWDKIIDELIWTFEFLGSEERWSCYNKKDWKRVHKGLRLFGKYLLDLWW